MIRKNALYILCFLFLGNYVIHASDFGSVIVGDNLGNHTAIEDLDINENSILNCYSIGVGTDSQSSPGIVISDGNIVVENSGLDGTITIKDSNNDQDIYLNTGGNSYFNGSGNFGIGTIIPSEKLHVDGNIKSNYGVITTSLTISGTQIFLSAQTEILFSSNSISSNSSYANIVSSGGIVTLTSDPQIESGIDGQIIEIFGNSDSNLIKLVDGNGLKLKGNVDFTLGLDDVISLRYREGSSTWCEINRSDN